MWPLLGPIIRCRENAIFKFDDAVIAIVYREPYNTQ